MDFGNILNEGVGVIMIRCKVYCMFREIIHSIRAVLYVVSLVVFNTRILFYNMYNVQKVLNYNKEGDVGVYPQERFNDEFISTISNVFKWARWIGIVGLEGFVWKMYGLTLLCLMFAIESQAIWKVVKVFAGWAIDMVGHRSLTARLSGTMFYTAALLGMIQCNCLSNSWKETSKCWASLENTLSIKYVPADRTLKKQMYKASGVLLFSALAVYMMNAISAINYHCELSVCLRTFILRTHGFMILDFEYSDLFGVVILFMNVIAIIVRNLHDIFIILISMGLTSRYKRLNACVASVAGSYDSKNKWCKSQDILQVHTWRKIREAYMKQANLVRQVNKSLGGLILVSSFFNFYFICFQLFLGIVQGISSDGLKNIYYLIQLIWLCGRTIYTVLSAADVHKYSKQALPFLYDCKTEFYNIEIQRLQRYLSRDYTALTGMDFFYLNRSVVLQLAGTVVTYVLMLVQYDGPDDQTLRNKTETTFR